MGFEGLNMVDPTHRIGEINFAALRYERIIKCEPGTKNRENHRFHVSEVRKSSRCLPEVACRGIARSFQSVFVPKPSCNDPQDPKSAGFDSVTKGPLPIFLCLRIR